ncbi:hypothetical protein [Brevundimonas sp. Marseille-Q4549]
MIALTLALMLQQAAAAPRPVEIAPGAPSTAAAPGTLPEPARPGDRLICRSETVVGSNRRQRVCMTAVQRDTRRQNGLALRDSMDRPYNPDLAVSSSGS